MLARDLISRARDEAGDHHPAPMPAPTPDRSQRRLRLSPDAGQRAGGGGQGIAIDPDPQINDNLATAVKLVRSVFVFRDLLNSP